MFISEIKNFIFCSRRNFLQVWLLYYGTVLQINMSGLVWGILYDFLR